MDKKNKSNSLPPTLTNINKITGYTTAKPIKDLAREKNLSKIIKLASNENPFGPSPKVIENLINNINTVNLYPDPNQIDLKTKLADFYNININNIAIGNGSDELIQLLIRAFVSNTHNVIAPNFSFISYQIACLIAGADYLTAELKSNWQSSLDNILKLINNNTKLICLANPTNPIGTCLNHDEIAEFIKQVPANILILLDEAYFEYIKYKQPTNNSINNNLSDLSIELLKKHSNIIITRSFSKAYGLAGLRAGYCIAHPDVITSINKLKLPFNTNSLVEFAAIAALEDQEYIKKIIAINNQQKNILYKTFDKLNINYILSETNFITIDLNNNIISVDDLYNKLLDNGIITRPIKNYGLENFLRISIGNEDENNFLISTLNNILNNNDK